MNDEIREFIRKDVVKRFMRYVQVYTTSDENNPGTPSTERQFDLARILEQEMKELGLKDVELDEHCYVYGTLPASREGAKAFGLISHVDTSPDQPGDNVKPRYIENWNGDTITYPDDPELTLSTETSPELERFKGENLIVASGKTLLGADDKAGVAEIMSAVAAILKYDLPHAEVRVVFTPDEEIGRGTIKIQEDKLPKVCYTVDGGLMGELEGECFDAWRADVKFTGRGVHPGYAKDKMLNAAGIAARFLAALPEWQTPEHTEKREGFFHIVSVEGDFENAKATMIIRDFEEDLNKQRMNLLESMKAMFEQRYPGLGIELTFTHQYQNMRDIVQLTPEIMEIAQKAMEEAGVDVIRKSIRGGTDGSRLTQLGHPTPNLFAGGMLFHSRHEWIPEVAMVKSVETLVALARLWGE